MTTHKKAKSDDAVNGVCKQRVQGIGAYTAGLPGLTINAKAFTWAQLGGIYQRCIDTRTALATARAAEETALAERDAADADRNAVDQEVLRWAGNTFGPDSVQAKAFGYVKPSRTAPTAAEKAAAVDKAKATKAARGETGKKAKTATVAAPADAAAPAAPAPGASGGTTTPTKS